MLKRNPRCQLCDLHRGANTVCVWGNGPKRAEVVVVGEAPGQNEDRTGVPFVGQAGRLLDRLLTSAGLDRSEVYVTNSVKCRPPENRKPRSVEVKTCATYVRSEIGMIEPKLVVLLGATAVEAMLGRGYKVTEDHGRVVRGADGYDYLPTFHPAAALRNPSWLKPLERDFLEVGRIVRGEPKRASNRIRYRVVVDHDSFGDMMADLIASEVVAYDTETTGLDRHDPDGRVNTIQFSTAQQNWVMGLRLLGAPWADDEAEQAKLLGLIADVLDGKTTVAQNGKFDNNWLMKRYGLKFRLTFDTMLAAHLLDENSSTSLKSQAVARLGVEAYDIDFKTKTGHGDLRTLVRYAAKDGSYTLQLYWILERELAADPALHRLFYELVMPTARAYEEVESAGVWIDREKLESVGGELEASRARATDELERLHPGVNWNSPVQIRQVLFDELRLEGSTRTPGGDLSTAESVLNELDHPVPKLILKFRESEKLISTYVNGWRERLKLDGYLYPSFKINGTVTGRPSCEDPNLQQTPRDKRIRSMISAPPGWIFFELDYSQIEMRVAALLSQDPYLLYLFQTGQDVHAMTAAEVLELDPSEVDEVQRKKAKAINFGFLYGMGYRKFVAYAKEKYGVVVSEREGKRVRQRYFERFAGLEPWHDRQRRIVHATEQVRTLTGRIRHLPLASSSDEGLVKQAEREAINAPVQGFAAELTLMALVEIVDEFDPSVLRVCGTIHDAIVGRVRRMNAKRRLARMREIMMKPRLLDQLGIKMNVPIDVEVKLGPWGIGRKVKV